MWRRPVLKKIPEGPGKDEYTKEKRKGEAVENYSNRSILGL